MYVFVGTRETILRQRKIIAYLHTTFFDCVQGIIYRQYFKNRYTFQRIMTTYLTSDSIIIVFDVNWPKNYQIDIGLCNDKVMVITKFQEYLALS